MSYKAFVRMNIAIIGNEETSFTLARGLLAAGHHIFIGIKETEIILPDELGKAYVTTIEDAAARADLIIMATNPANVREAAYLLGDVRKKVILDVSYMSCPLSQQYLNTLSAIKSITGALYIVKCFNAAGFQPLSRSTGKDNIINMFLAGDNPKAKAVAKWVARDLGFAECHDFGGNDSATLLDEMAICYRHLAAHKEKGEKIAIKITRG